jgi:hypothetical protein
MTTTSRQDAELVNLINKDGSLEFEIAAGNELKIDNLDASIVVEWVAETFSPEEVFSSEELELWAKDHGFVKESGEQ